MPQPTALREFVRAYRAEGGGALSPSRAARLVELAAASLDELERLRVQVEVMALEVDAHESVSAELAGSAARAARLGSDTNPHPLELDATPGSSMHEHWQEGWEVWDRVGELERQCQSLADENAALRQQLEACRTPVTPGLAPTG